MRQQLTNKVIMLKQAYAGMFSFADLNLGLYLGGHFADNYKAVAPVDTDDEPGIGRLLSMT